MKNKQKFFGYVPATLQQLRRWQRDVSVLGSRRNGGCLGLDRWRRSEVKVILEAAALTAVVVAGLTFYTFWAAKRGHEFNFLGPFLTAALLVMMIYLIVQIFLPVGKVGATIYGCFAALVFAGFIIYDTDNLIKRHFYDEYVCAAISLLPRQSQSLSIDRHCFQRCRLLKLSHVSLLSTEGIC